MKFLSACACYCAFLLFFVFCPQTWAADLTLMHKGENVHLVMLGYGPLCEAKVESIAPATVTVALSKRISECGRKNEQIQFTKKDVVDFAIEKRLTKRRILSRILLGTAEIAALAAVPLTSSDPESWLLLANGVVPAFIFYYGGWRVLPEQRDYVLTFSCPDKYHCFSKLQDH